MRIRKKMEVRFVDKEDDGNDNDDAPRSTTNERKMM